ncbi:MAG: hypothetical protein J7L26_03425 [Candidatus Aminicenantes bacterium]|nr:hypothetical protein [Candidatus Aminicenantes bacterium]
MLTYHVQLHSSGIKDILWAWRCLKIKKPCPLLFSYALWPTEKFKSVLEFIADFGVPVRYILDSGAFTGYKEHKLLSIEKYADWLREFGKGADFYFTLDVIGSDKKTKENFEKLCQLGFSPIPVWHVLWSSVEILEQWVQKPISLLAIGGLVIKGGKERIIRKTLNSVWGLLSEHRVHGLGMGTTRWLRKYPWYSIDSSFLAKEMSGAGLVMLLSGGKIKRVSVGYKFPEGLRKIFCYKPSFCMLEHEFGLNGIFEEFLNLATREYKNGKPTAEFRRFRLLVSLATLEQINRYREQYVSDNKEIHHSSRA